MKTVEVFKTNVTELYEAEKIIAKLQQHFPGSRINIDLEDRDKVLRVEGKDLIAGKVIVLLKENGFTCNILE